MPTPPRVMSRNPGRFCGSCSSNSPSPSHGSDLCLRASLQDLSNGMHILGKGLGGDLKVRIAILALDSGSVTHVVANRIFAAVSTLKCVREHFQTEDSITFVSHRIAWYRRVVHAITLWFVRSETVWGRV